MVAPAAVVVTYSGWNAAADEVQIAGYVQGSDNPPGICTVTLEHGGTEVSQQRTALVDVMTTDCGTISISGASMAAGNWTGMVTYVSSRRHAISVPFVVTVVK